MENYNFTSPLIYKLIYVFTIHQETHKGCLKVGETTIETNKDYTALIPSCDELNYAAKKRIDAYTSTAGIRYDLLYTEVAIFKDKNGSLHAFKDSNVHDVLKRSGIKKKVFNTNKKQTEWFETDLQTVKNAIKAVKENKSSLNANQVTTYKNPIIFRPEQLDAINKTISNFKAGDKMLWNAKMRFGKTLTSLEVVKRMGFKKTIIVTHRPVVNEGWYEDFEKIFYDKNDYIYGSKTKGAKFTELKKCSKNFVYFSSMQDLRGSDKVGGNFNKNKDIFKTDWDFVVVDEAHEGTQTKLGKKVLEALIKPKSKKKSYSLELSGTPFNLITDYDSNSIYTWDYIMEQEAKQNFVLNHLGDSNPYEELPKMNIYTYRLEKTLPSYLDFQNKAFNFREFFRIWTGDIEKDNKRIEDKSSIGKFVHEEDIISFLNLLTTNDDDTNYPYSKTEYQEFFRHALWVVPGVKEAKALSSLLKKHHIFKNFKIINVAGDGDEEIGANDALKLVKNAISKHPEETRTITLSCSRLTTGVSIPEWTCVLMLAGSYPTSASQYLQTIFRVQTPANFDGRIKSNCYVFDFAPDRTLRMIAESLHLSSRTSNSLIDVQLGKFLNFSPVISFEGSRMTEFTVDSLLQEFKRMLYERVARNGFDDKKLYNDELLKLDDVELKEFSELKKIIGASPNAHSQKEIDINNQGLNNEEYEELEKLNKKTKKYLTEEEKEKLAKLEKEKKNRDSAISILRGISIRIPLIVYGIDKDIDVDITIDNFAEKNLIDDLSWEEFMPKGVTRELFKKFSKYYDKDIFIGACRRIRSISKSADELEPTERVKKIVSLFSTFKNPDKETVLTPWRVVNMHMSDTIGGYDFFDEKHENILNDPRLVDQGEVTKEVLFNKATNILEINSKTGLYPLYVTYSIYRYLLSLENKEDISDTKKKELWNKVCKNNIFVICKTPMAKLITKRTLIGYTNEKVNTRFFEDLVNQLKQKNKQKTFIETMHKGKSYWKVKEDDNMKFNAVVGNPPYQAMDGGGQASASPLYHYFVNSAIHLNSKYISIIMPSRWMIGGKGLDKFRLTFIKDTHIEKLYDYPNSKNIFSNVDIKGGICYFLRNNTYNGKCKITTINNNEKIISLRFLKQQDVDVFIRDERQNSILDKIFYEKGCFDSIVSSRKPYGLEGETMLNAQKFGLPSFSESKIDNGFSVLGLGEKQKRMWKYIPNDYPIPKDNICLHKYKVFIARAYGCGALGEVASTPVLSTPGQLCTETFLEIGPFNNKEESEAVIKYIYTKFFRVLVGILKITQDATKKVYNFVPIQDFTSKSDINWELPINKIDELLYKKYSLTSDDINYIEENVAEMKYNIKK